jgi:hypothetical protein
MPIKMIPSNWGRIDPLTVFRIQSRRSRRSAHVVNERLKKIHDPAGTAGKVN